ncbi:MAG: glycosyltransferase family 39 protein [Tannerellaceae bacterium]|jgi:4-amino-4-deoxy-L-arabinose transferase-like glycosyltransferase|nr:glycosyltransferase family 39 protein [Tannerellaceae bacterium]
MKKYKIGSFEFDLFAILLLVLAVMAFLLRIYNVGYLTLWVDEYVHVNTARHFPEQSLFTNDNNGILLTMFIVPFFKLFGVSEFWARFPSVVFGTLLVPLVYLFAKRYFNRSVGLLSAALVTCSTYLVFWSRISRNYAIFAFFFLLFLYLLGRAINVDGGFQERKSRLLNYLKWQPRYLWMALAVFVLSLMSHQLTFLAVYGVLFYYLLLFVHSLVSRKARFLSLEAVISYLFLAVSMVVFVPAIQELIKPVLLLFLPEPVVVWVLPNLTRLSELWTTAPYETFNIYFDVLRSDYTPIYMLGFAGFIASIARYRKAGYYLTAIFAGLFLVMSFVFREPSLPRYLMYIYPLFLIAIALAVDTIVFLLEKRFKSFKLFKPVILAVAVIGATGFFPTIRKSVRLMKNTEHGELVPRALSSFYFPDWKSSLAKVKQHLGENDLLISTMPAYVDFYLGRNSYQFRQMLYDTGQHNYVNYPVDTVQPNAYSTEGLIKLMDSADKGWLMADYYFYNVMTDPETREYVIHNMKFEYDMSNRYVSIFSWDKSQPFTPNAIVEFLHEEYPYSNEYQINLPEVKSDMAVVLEMEGITADDQILLLVNGKAVSVRREYGELFQRNGDSKSRQNYMIPVPAKAFKEGANGFQIILAKPGGSFPKGCFAAYRIRLFVLK